MKCLPFNQQTTGASSSTNKNYQASQSSSKPAQQQQQLPANYRSSMSSHSDIFMKADEQKINFGRFTKPFLIEIFYSINLNIRFVDEFFFSWPWKFDFLKIAHKSTQCVERINNKIY